ncbi:MAG: hypothetical protein AAF280_05205 [Pseudomonadota bacterium]
MRYVLYNRPGSDGIAEEAAMALAGVECRVESLTSLPNEPLCARIGHHHDWGQVPVLELPDGATLSERSAIMAYLAQQERDFRDRPHWRVPHMAGFLRWCMLLCVNVYKGILRRIYPNRFWVSRDRPGTAADTGSDAVLLQYVSDTTEHRTYKAPLSLQRATGAHAFSLGDQMSACNVIVAMLYA